MMEVYRSRYDEKMQSRSQNSIVFNAKLSLLPYPLIHCLFLADLGIQTAKIYRLSSLFENRLVLVAPNLASPDAL